MGPLTGNSLLWVTFICESGIFLGLFYYLGVRGFVFTVLVPFFHTYSLNPLSPLTSHPLHPAPVQAGTPRVLGMQVPGGWASFLPCP